MSPLFAQVLSLYLLLSVLVFIVTLGTTEHRATAPTTALIVSVTLLWPLYAVALTVSGLILGLIYFCKWMARMAKYMGSVYAS